MLGTFCNSTVFRFLFCFVFFHTICQLPRLLMLTKHRYHMIATVLYWKLEPTVRVLTDINKISYVPENTYLVASFLLEMVLSFLHLLSVLWLWDHVTSLHLTDLDLVLFVSQTVIRAKVVGEKEVDSGNDIYGNPIKRIQYEVKQIKVSPPSVLVKRV